MGVGSMRTRAMTEVSTTTVVSITGKSIALELERDSTLLPLL